jgi:hypothetical protein
MCKKAKKPKPNLIIKHATYSSYKKVSERLYQAAKLAFDLHGFIKQNKEKIDAITPVNPPISKDDEWRDESYDIDVKDDNTNEQINDI